MPGVKRKRESLNAEQRLEIGKLIDEGKLTVKEASDNYKIGFSTAGACRTAYRNGLNGKPMPKAIPPVKKSKPQKKPMPRVIKGIRYDDEFKAKAVKMVLNGGSPNVRLTHKEVGDELGISPSGVRKWVVDYDNGIGPARAASVDPIHEQRKILNRTDEVEPQAQLTNEDIPLTITDSYLLRIATLEAELALLKPMVRRYLNL